MNHGWFLKFANVNNIRQYILWNLKVIGIVPRFGWVDEWCWNNVLSLDLLHSLQFILLQIIERCVLLWDVSSALAVSPAFSVVGFGSIFIIRYYFKFLII